MPKSIGTELHNVGADQFDAPSPGADMKIVLLVMVHRCETGSFCLNAMAYGAVSAGLRLPRFKSGLCKSFARLTVLITVFIDSRHVLQGVVCANACLSRK